MGKPQNISCLPYLGIANTLQSAETENSYWINKQEMFVLKVL